MDEQIKNSYVILSARLSGRQEAKNLGIKDLVFKTEILRRGSASLTILSLSKGYSPQDDENSR